VGIHHAIVLLQTSVVVVIQAWMEIGRVTASAKSSGLNQP
jgi:hypothetical protein